MSFNWLITVVQRNVEQFFCGLVGLFCGCILGGSWLVEHLLHIQPCILCTIQRLLFLSILLCCLAWLLTIHIMRVPPNTPKRNVAAGLFLSMMSIFIVLGILVAARQSWLQIRPGLHLASCSKGLFSMLQDHSLFKVMGMAIKGKFECSAVELTIFKLSLANWSLLSFVSILSVGLIYVYQIYFKMRA